MFLCYVSFGQERTITGVVSDNNEVLPFVKILVKDTPRGTLSDVDGKFSIEVKTGAILVFNYIGYDKLEVKIKKKTTSLKIVLKSNITLLSETNSDPIPDKKKTKTAVLSISKDDIEKP
jgi:Ca-activated chloride channel family protein